MSDLSTGEAPLSQPLYGATFSQAITRFFKKYATFTGRASRSEFWWFFLFNFIVTFVITGLPALFGGFTVTPEGTMAPSAALTIGYILAGIWALATLVPWLALSWRRFHDTNRSGAFYFLAFIPVVGTIIVIIMLALPSEPAGARFDV